MTDSNTRITQYLGFSCSDYIGKMEFMKYDSTKYKVTTLKHPAMLFWFLNPGSVINELVLGQRVPKITLTDKFSDKSLGDRTYIPCPHCHTLHPSIKWSAESKTGFRNWFGLYCDQCGNIIPVITSLTSFFILAITFPFRYWFKNSMKRNWLHKQPARYHALNVDKITRPYEAGEWIKTGIGFGLLMFVAIFILLPLFTTNEITTNSILHGLLFAILGGLLFGFTLKLYFGQKGIKHNR